MNHVARGMRARRRRDAPGRLLLLGALCVTLAACTGPVRAVRVDRTVAHRDLTRSVVTTGQLSWATRDVLLERGLYDTFDDRPEVAIAELHRAMVDAQGDEDLLYALAEASFLHGQAARTREYQLAAATTPIAGANDGGDMVAPRLRVPLTALLRIPHARHALVEGRAITATLELHLAWDEDAVSIAGERVPLESEPTAALALTFTG